MVVVLTPAGPLQLVFQDVATPLTNTHYLGAQRGAMYSAEHNLERFHAEAVARNRCNTPVKNLYLSGETPPPAPSQSWKSQTLTCNWRVHRRHKHWNQSVSIIYWSFSEQQYLHFNTRGTSDTFQAEIKQQTEMKSAKKKQLSRTSVCQWKQQQEKQRSCRDFRVE